MNPFRLYTSFALIAWLWMTSLAVAADEHLIAVVMANSQPRYQEIHAIFDKQSKSFCTSDCRIYVQTPNADIMSLRNSVRKAVALGADLIVTYGPAATLAAKAESPPVPTLFADVYDPVKLGLVSAKSKTGRNMTGVRGDAPVQALFKYFSDTTSPGTLAVLYDIHSPAGKAQKETLEESCKRRDVVLLPLEVKNPKDHITPLKQLTAEVDGVFLASSEHTSSHMTHVLEYIASNQIPVITQRAGAADIGAFMVLETSSEEQGTKLAEMAAQILAGKSTDDLPMHKPHKVAFVVNMKVAKKYNIKVPFQTLSVASRVIR